MTLTLSLQDLLTLTIIGDESLYVNRQWLARNTMAPFFGKVIRPGLAAEVRALDPEELCSHVETYVADGLTTHVLWAIADWRESNERRRLIVAAAAVTSQPYLARQACEALTQEALVQAAKIGMDTRFMLGLLRRRYESADCDLGAFVAYLNHLEDFMSIDTKQTIKLYERKADQVTAIETPSPDREEGGADRSAGQPPDSAGPAGGGGSEESGRRGDEEGTAGDSQSAPGGGEDGQGGNGPDLEVHQ